MQPAAASIQPTPRPRLEAILERLRDGAARFARLAPRDRLALLVEIRAGYLRVLDAAVRAGCVAKGIDPDSEQAGEEWLAHGFCVMRHLRLLQDSLEQIVDTGSPRLDGSWMRERPDGALAVRLYPLSRLDAVAFPGITAEAWMERGLTRDDLRSRQASFYKHPHAGRVALVLGAGNVPSIPPRDALTKMFNEGRACLLKMNPVNEYLGPYIEEAFRPAIERGFMAVVYGGADEGSFLANHAFVDEVHITGSDKTHDAIVWGPPGPEREERRRQNRPLLQKEVTSELGNVSPVVVVPGPWRDADLEYQGRNIAGMVTNNASFNCNAAKLVIDPRGWRHREGLLNAVERALARVPPRLAYYPGALDRYRRFTSGRRRVHEFGQAQSGHLPWAVVPDIDPQDRSEPFFRDEPWCSVLAETALGTADPVEFLDAAVRFVNERVWGTLCVTLLVHPETERDPRFAAALGKALEDLRYGTIAINLWPAAGFSMGTTPWGAHPSGTLGDIQSGRGFIGNTLMLEGIEKTVLRAPFQMVPKPVWFPDHRSQGTLARRVTELERTGSWTRVPAVALAALRG